ncbi:Aspyridones efflux protein apdF [Lachnellula suecica]|uniref:Aspyridones efflux protein apdF n=1 Tax=Lachnellula suecica TaxID=602035 RepID=A0A8T9C6E8_9HELO|nr:Aspyridones efflux protein apdF [Lachnellula suecica]
MTEMTSTAHDRENPSTNALDKDVEIQTVHSNSNSDEEIGDGEEKDVEAYPVVSNNGKGDAVTRTSTKSSWKDPGPPPDGGIGAWTQAILGHLVIMNTWGFINSFGVFQTYYVGTFTGRLTDAGYFRPVFIIGSLAGVIGVFMASLSTTYWQLLLAQGVCCGLGNGCLFCPSLTILSTYFSKKRSLAIGIAAAGSATGGMIFPAMVQQLLPRIGFAWTMRSLGFIQLGCLIICNIGIKPRVPPRRTGELVDWASFKEVPYVLFAIGMFFNFWGVYFAFYYLGTYARNIIGMPYTSSINLLIVLNGVGVLGRIVPNYLADRYFGPLNSLIPVVFVTSILCFCWISVSSQGGLYAWAVIYGIVGAAIQSLFPATLSSLTTDLRKAGVRMGQVFTIVSFAVLTGPPIAGELIQRKGGEFEYAQIFAGLDLFVGFIFISAARRTKSKQLRDKM